MPKLIIIFKNSSEGLQEYLRALIVNVMDSCVFNQRNYPLAFKIMEEAKTEQPEMTTEEVVEAETKTEIVAETAVETETEETSVTTVVNKEVDPNTSNYIRLRGLPFSAKEDDVRAFLEGQNLSKT